jgi:hypothetical protein
MMANWDTSAEEPAVVDTEVAGVLYPQLEDVFLLAAMRTLGAIHEIPPHGDNNIDSPLPVAPSITSDSIALRKKSHNPIGAFGGEHVIRQPPCSRIGRPNLAGSEVSRNGQPVSGINAKINSERQFAEFESVPSR